jgi:hypothetical protein
MITIYKYPISIEDATIIDMPVDAQILSIQVQHRKIVLWALVESDNQNEQRVFEIYGTGHNMDHYYKEGRIHRATVQWGDLVWHIFEKLIT